MRAIEEILVEYDNKSKDPEYAGYSSLQCVIYDGNLEETQAMIEHYRENATLHDELSRVSPVDSTHENILHVAMKHPSIFSLCCNAIETVDPTLFKQHIQQVDADGDTVFHQIAEFGRSESLTIFKPYLMKHVDPTDLAEALAQPNKCHETASEIVENYDKTKTIDQLRKSKILSVENVGNARKNAREIQAIFNDELLPEKMAGMTM